MLLRFRARNVLSLRDTQELSLVATELNEGSARPSGARADGRDVLAVPLAAIYGSNASGKSNVLKALELMRTAVLRSMAWRGMDFEPVRRVPFLLDTTSPTQPSEFEAEIVTDGVRYEYGFSIGDENVQSEWLYAYPKGRKQVWFERDADVEPPVRFPGEGLKGARSSLVEQTRPDALFLTVGAQLNNPQLAEVYAWFRYNLVLTGPREALRLSRVPTGQWLARDGQSRRRVEELLRVADVGVLGLEILDQESRGVSIRLVHRAGDRGVPLDMYRESNGTRSWLALLRPLLTALDRGSVVLVDELDASLHPRMVAEIVGMFASPRSNPHGAQLVFTTHDVSLLGNLPADRLLDRDEIWLTEKDKDGATELYPISALKPRKDENLERGYLLGRYGSVPRMMTGQLSRVAEGGPSEANE